MPIQFRCGSCNQPVEVDDEAAGQFVKCPFCEGLSRAPAAQGTPTESVENIPVAGVSAEAPKPVTLPTQGSGLPQPYASASANRGSQLSWMALAACGLAVVCFIACLSSIASVIPDLKPHLDDPVEQQRIFEDHVARHPWVGMAMLGSFGFILLGGALGVVALIKQSTPAWPAIVSLTISGVFMLMMCAGLFIGPR